MANKIKVKLILELRDARMSRNGIASTRHMSRHSVSDVFRIADELGVTYQDVRFLDENEVYRMFFPDKHAVDDLYKDQDMKHFSMKKSICMHCRKSLMRLPLGFMDAQLI